MWLKISRNVEWMSPGTAPGAQTKIEKRRVESLEYSIHLRSRGFSSLPWHRFLVLSGTRMFTPDAPAEGKC